MSPKCKEHKKGERQAVHMHYLPFGARGPGDLGLRGPERSEDIELSSPGMGSKIIKE